MEIPTTKHPKLPDGVPLAADFHDDRNRLSYYYPIIRDMERVRTPVTQFYRIEGDFGSYPELEYREITRFMQDQQMREAFVRGDFSSGKYDESGCHIESQDPYDIEGTVIEMMRQLFRGQRHLGGRIAVREWIPHETEVRFFLRDGEILYADSVDEENDTSWPWVMARLIARQMDTYAWSCDFIKHEKTGKWYCIDMGLDGLRPHAGEWIQISEHIQDEHSPEQYADEMPGPETFNY